MSKKLYTIHHKDLCYLLGNKTFYVHEDNLQSYAKQKVLVVQGRRETRMFFRLRQDIIYNQHSSSRHKANLIYESECGIFKLQIGIACPMNLKQKRKTKVDP